MSYRPKKRPALLFGEGGKEVTFFNFLLKTEKFEFLENVWSFETGHASGSSCETVLAKCIKLKNDEREYEKVLCFIDTDKLTHDFPKSYTQKREELNARAEQEGIEIIWQESDHENELSRATGGKIEKKQHMKRRLEAHKQMILGSDYVKNIFNHFHNK
jgi:hypothetical protein